MREITGDLFAHNANGPDAICITTNGFVNRHGENIMGRGVAGEAKKRWPGIAKELGMRLRAEGNRPHLLTRTQEGQTHVAGHFVPYHIVSFPTKPDVCTFDMLLPYYQRKVRMDQRFYPGWMSRSHPFLIEVSARLLAELAKDHGWQSVVLPRPGCGAGGLRWEDIKPRLESQLDDRFYVISPKE